METHRAGSHEANSDGRLAVCEEEASLLPQLSSRDVVRLCEEVAALRRMEKEPPAQG